MKTLFVLVITFISLNLFATPYFDKYSTIDNVKFSCSTGVAYITGDFLASNNSGFYLDFEFFKVHLDFASNFSSGEGTYLDFTSSKTYKTHKRSWVYFHIGYSFPLWKTIMVTPKIGMITIDNIYEDKLAFDTYFTKTLSNAFSSGFDIAYKIPNSRLYLKSGITYAIDNVTNTGLGGLFTIGFAI